MQPKLYQYGIFYVPNEEQAKTGAKAQILKDITTILATSDQSANITASRQIPEEYLDKLDQITIALRPF